MISACRKCGKLVDMTGVMMMNEEKFEIVGTGCLADGQGIVIKRILKNGEQKLDPEEKPQIRFRLSSKSE